MPSPDRFSDLFRPIAPPAARARYRVRHVTRYDYVDPVLLAHHRLHLSPRAVAGQSCARHALTIDPPPSTSACRFDFFGNPVIYASIEEPHRELLVSLDMMVEVVAPEPVDPDATPGWEDIRDQLRFAATPTALETVGFAHRSALVPDLDPLARFAAPSFPPRRPIALAALDLMRRIHRDFTFDPKATTISTPLADVLERRRGVCQDFAHLLIGCLRALGLSARYVSGYIRTVPPAGKPRLVGADASHAWVSVWCGEDLWLDLDPTNGKPRDADFIMVAWGRDYADVSPISGVLLGGSDRQKLDVAVDVESMTSSNG